MQSNSQVTNENVWISGCLLIYNLANVDPNMVSIFPLTFSRRQDAVTRERSKCH